MDQPVWAKLIKEAEEIRTRIGLVHDAFHQTCDLELRDDLADLWNQYAKKVHLMESINPSYVIDFRERAKARTATLNAQVEALWDQDDPDFDDLLVKYELSMDLESVGLGGTDGKR